MTAPTRPLSEASLLRATTILCRDDGALAAIVERFGPPPLWGRRPGFATLVRIILEQQVSLASARALFLRLQAAVGGVAPDRIAALGVAGLQRLGLTRQKAAYCAGLADRVRAGDLDLRRVARLPGEAGRRELLAVHGIGPWTADIYFLMALRRPDVWPVGDLALAQAAIGALRLRSRPSPDRLARLARRWIPWRSVAARILWHYYLSSRSGDAPE